MRMIKKQTKKRGVRRPIVRKTRVRETKQRVSEVPEAATYVTEKHWELW